MRTLSPKAVKTNSKKPNSRGVKRRSQFVFERLDARTLLSGDIQVSVFQDVNGDGLQDAGDTPQAGWSVFVDLNSNGAHDAGEPQLVTGSDGTATFTALANKTYDVVEVMQSGFTTAPGFHLSKKASVTSNQVRPILFMNQSITNGAVQGTVWSDINGDGIRQVGDPGLSGWTVFIDKNNNHVLDTGETSTLTDANGFYSLPNLVPGSYRICEVLQSGYSATTGFAANADVNVNNGLATTQDFGNFNPASVGSVSGVVWNDINADGIREIGDPALSGWTTFIDTNNNGVLDAGEQSAVTDANGAYRFPILFPGSYGVREVMQPSWLISPTFHNPAAISVVGGSETKTDFANFTPVAGTATGTVYNDLNGDGFQSAGEPGLAGWSVYVDANNNGVLDAGEVSTTTDASGNYTVTGLPLGSSVIREVPAIGWLALTPGTGSQLLTLLNGAAVSGVNFGNQQRTDGAISGTAFDDLNHNGVRDAGEKGLAGITIYQDVNNNGVLDAGEPSTITSADLFYTPAVDEAGTYTFTHLATGIYNIREIVPTVLSGTPASVSLQTVNLLPGEDRHGVDFADQYRGNEIHGVKFNDLNGNHVQDAGEPTMPGVTIYLDLNRNGTLDAGEPSTTTASDGSYAFTGLSAGAYVVRDVLPAGHQHTYPTTGGGILWPGGVSNPASGNVTPISITASLAQGETYQQTVSLTLPTSGAITNKADVFLLFDDTGSFTANSPIVQAAFPTIISSLEAALPGLDLGFGVGRFEEYGNFAAEFGTGRPFILNQPIVSSATPGFSTAIQSALSRTTPGYGGDQPEADIEALFQTVTGRGFDGNNNGTTTDSGAAGQVATQLTPGNSGDVPAFSSYLPDATGPTLAPQGTIGGAGFRDGALPIILQATDTGFAYQPKGETSITGTNGLTLPISALTQTSRPTTPFSSGAGLQETVTGLNALGALVIGLGTNAQTNLDPRQGLEALAKLTGAVNHSLSPIVNGTGAPILPGDPLYFQIASGFGASVANGVVSAIANAATSVAVNVTLKASDPRVHITFNPGVIDGLTSGQTATFTVTFTGDGIPHRFDLQFVREGTNVVLGSIPVVLGTPIVGEGYEYEDMGEGEIHNSQDFGSTVVTGTSTVTGSVFDDHNGDGIFNAGDTAIVGATVYADLNNSGGFDVGEPSAVSTATGDYSVGGLASGTYTMRFLATAGVAVTNPLGNGVSVTCTPGATVAGTNFGTFPTVFTASGSSNYYVQAVGGLSQIWMNTPTTAAPTYTMATASMPALTFIGGAGDDAVTIDLSQATTLPASGFSFDGGAGTNTVTFIGRAGSDTISANASSVTIDGVTTNLANASNVSIDPGTGSDSLLVSSGIIHLPAASAAGITARNFSNLTIGATAVVEVDSPPTPAQRSVLVVSGMNLSTSGTFDLGGNDLIVRNGDPLLIEGLIRSGANMASGGYWNGIGIQSSAAATDPTFLTGVGAMLNDNGAGQPIFSTAPGAVAFDGQSTSATDMLVKYTYYGDTNLDGRVDGSDYSKIDFGVLSSATGWGNGDFNLDNVVNGSDYTLIDNAFNRQGSTLSPAAQIASVVAPMTVPTPMSATTSDAIWSTERKHATRPAQLLFSERTILDETNV